MIFKSLKIKSILNYHHIEIVRPAMYAHKSLPLLGDNIKRRRLLPSPQKLTFSF